MQIVITLLVIAMALGLLSGFFVLLGAEKESRPFAIFFVLFCLAYVFWTGLTFNNQLMMASINASVVFFMATLLITIWSFVNMHNNRATRAHRGWRLVAISYLVLADIAAIFYYILVRNDFTIARFAPLIIAPIFVIMFYVAIRYRVMQISNRFCKIWGYSVLSLVSVFVYMCLFYLISEFLFHVEVSAEIIALNLLMVIILVAIFPIWREFNSAMSSVLSTTKINLNYIVKMLNRFATQNVRLEDLAEFLADHLHFRYIGIAVDGKVYGTKKIDFSEKDLAELTTLEPNKKNLWLKPSGYIKESLESKKIVAVAELRDASGRPFGQILIGQPNGKTSFEKRDLSGVEMIINLVASIVDSKERLLDKGVSK